MKCLVFSLIMQLKEFSNPTSMFHSVPYSEEKKISKDEAHLSTIALKLTSILEVFHRHKIASKKAASKFRLLVAPFVFPILLKTGLTAIYLHHLKRTYGLTNACDILLSGCCTSS